MCSISNSFSLHCSQSTGGQEDRNYEHWRELGGENEEGKMQWIIWGEPEQAPNTRVTYSEFAVPMYCMYDVVCMHVCIYVVICHPRAHSACAICQCIASLRSCTFNTCIQMLRVRTWSVMVIIIAVWLFVVPEFSIHWAGAGCGKLKIKWQWQPRLQSLRYSSVHTLRCKRKSWQCIGLMEIDS